MKYFGKLGLVTLVALCSISMSYSAQAKSNQPYPNKGGDVEYNATPNSPTLPLVQYPPPQNYPTSVQIGTPSYYYYYPPMYGPGYGGGGYGPGYGGGAAGVSFYNNGGATQRGFYYNTPIPGQVNIGGGGWGGGAFGGYGGSGGYGPGYGGYNGGLFVP